MDVKSVQIADTRKGSKRAIGDLLFNHWSMRDPAQSPPGPE
jgi:hypothetical protein